MGIDYSKRLYDFAVFLPALWPPYLDTASGSTSLKSRPKYDIGKFNFFDHKASKDTFYYPFGLYSAGLGGYNKRNIETKQPMIYGRDMNAVRLMTDSGGYQIIFGKLIANWGNVPARDRVRRKILKWQANTGSIGAIIDVPTGCIASKKQPYFNTFDQCLNQTVDNIDFQFKYFEKESIEHPFMNVIQGRTIAEREAWYDGVKQFSLQGWCFGGLDKLDFYSILRLLIKMRDDGNLENSKGQNSIHFFGVAKPVWSLAFTRIKKCLLQHNPEMEVTYDTSTYGLMAGKAARVYLYFDGFSDYQSMSMRAPMYRPAHGQLSNQNMTEFYEFWNNNDTLGLISAETDLVVKSTGKGWDEVSEAIVSMLNLKVLIEEIQGLNYNFFKPKGPKFPTTLHPQFNWLDIERLDKIIQDVFSSSMPMTIIGRNKRFLESYKGR